MVAIMYWFSLWIDVMLFRQGQVLYFSRMHPTHVCALCFWQLGDANHCNGMDGQHHEALLHQRAVSLNQKGTEQGPDPCDCVGSTMTLRAIDIEQI
jgi:hypothetical protein